MLFWITFISTPDKLGIDTERLDLCKSPTYIFFYSCSHYLLKDPRKITKPWYKVHSDIIVRELLVWNAIRRDIWWINIVSTCQEITFDYSRDATCIYRCHGNLMLCRIPYTGLWVLVFLGLFMCAISEGSGEIRGCAGSPEPSLVAYVISTIISWAG